MTKATTPAERLAELHANSTQGEWFIVRYGDGNSFTPMTSSASSFRQ